MKIQAAKRLRGRVPGLPGDKSISHRAALVAALARGRTTISNYSTSADCASTLACLAQLGVSIERDGNTVVIKGIGGETGAPAFRPPASALDCGNSGSTMRLLAGVLAAQPFASTLTGDASLRARPMRRIIEPLGLMGVQLSSDGGHAPLRVEGRAPLDSIEYEMPIASAQVKSCVLLAGLGARGRTRVIERGARTRDHTERILRWMGVRVETEEQTGEDGTRRFSASIEGPAHFAARDLSVPGDISSAAFLVCAAALLPGSDLVIDGVGLNSTRAQILDTLALLGCDVRAENVRESCNELTGDIRVRGGVGARSVEPTGRATPFVLRGHVIAGLIDELPVLAVIGSQIGGGLEIRDARELRVKESDRISTTIENLRAMGAEVEEFDDGMKIHGRAKLRGAKLDAHGDHRVAMAFTVAALLAEGESEIEGAEECVGVSFPEFFPLLESLTER